MNTENKTPTPEPINAPDVLNIDKIIDVDSLKDNSVLVLRFTEASPRVSHTIQALIQRYAPQIRAKNISVLIMSPQDSIETLEEAKMNAIGWFKKEKSRLILP